MKMIVRLLRWSDRWRMNFPQFWAKGQSGNFAAWRWSSQSLAEAQALANQAVQQLVERFRDGGFPPKYGGYYPNRPFREPVLHEIRDDAGAVAAVVTRNSYGCQVLNTAKVMFVDIDLPEPKPAGGFFKRLFGKPDLTKPATTLEGSLAQIENWTRTHSDWGWRIYQTRAGLRLLATHGLVDADSEAAAGVFAALGADPLYQKLCQAQKCFRARLTPKPWRCGVHMKPERWPWPDEKRERLFQRWEAHYQSYAANWATCTLVRQIGNPTVHPDVETIIKLHDGATKVASDLKLA